jgi:hypothetical protein
MGIWLESLNGKVRRVIENERFGWGFLLEVWLGFLIGGFRRDFE